MTIISTTANSTEIFVGRRIYNDFGNFSSAIDNAVNGTVMLMRLLGFDLMLVMITSR